MAELSKLGRYELRRVLGKGAMGVVYEGYDPTLGRQVAIKTILRSAALDAETERGYSERFAREAKAVARLNHPNIVQVHDFGVENDVAYLVMEFIRGRELGSYFAGLERFEIADTVRIMGELLDALDFAHEAGVIHRDVKPANVMLDAQRRVKLADFGVARVQESERSGGGTMVGTPAFMSPEQIQGHKVDRRTDIFSAGIILYQLLTGEQPFKGDGAWTVARRIMQEEPPLPSTLATNISPVFDAIVDKALAKQPGERFANAREFADALRGALAPVSPGTAAAIPLRTRPRTALPVSDAELEFWRSIQNSSVPAEFEVYLQQFPEGTYAGLARVRLQMLGAGTPRADDATVALVEPRATGKRLPALAVIAVLLVAAGAGAYLTISPTPAPKPPEAVKLEVPAADIAKIRKEAEERVRRELADKTAAEQAAAAKAAIEKATQEKLLAMKAAAEKAAADKAAADKVAAEKAAIEKAIAAARLAGDKAALEKAAAERIAAEKVSAEKQAAEKASAERVAAEKAAAEKAAAEKVAAEKAAAEKIGANSVEAQLERFIQRKGRDKVLTAEPPSIAFAMGHGEVLYVNDGSCPPGRIKEITGTNTGNMGSSAGSPLRPSPRPTRCISLAD